MGIEGVPDTKTNWPTDRRSQNQPQPQPQPQPQSLFLDYTNRRMRY
jgi:hypothetical protein